MSPMPIKTPSRLYLIRFACYYTDSLNFSLVEHRELGGRQAARSKVLKWMHTHRALPTGHKSA